MAKMAEISTIYLDNNATTRPAEAVVEAMLPALRERFGNPSSLHAAGARAARDLVRARERVAAFLGADPAEIVFTSGGTEANGLAIRGALAAGKPHGRRRIVTTAVEHPSVQATIERLRAAGECRASVVPVLPDGRLDLAALGAALEPADDVALVSLMWANNETGLVFPVDDVGALCRERGVLFHSDAVQAAGKIKIGAASRPIDLLAISAHKIHGPKGAGALFVRRGTTLEPALAGGPQERGLRGGTENVPAIVGFAAACDLATRASEGGAIERMAALRDRLEERILAGVPRALRNGAARPRVAGTTSLRFAGVDGAALVLELSRRGIAASSGSACASGSLEPSPVLAAMGLSAEEARGALRLSLSRETTEAEVDLAAAAVVETVARLRTIAAAPAAAAR
jgi:cysteine desulfurase